MTITSRIVGLPVASVFIFFAALSHAADGPNFLWLVSEDNGPQIGAYGDTFATTPNIDALAAKSVRYLNAWSTAPVCAPARSALITGMYPYSIGTHNMRSRVTVPASIRMYPEYLRDAGYYCSNNAKEDYNLILNEEIWDESSRKAHWKNRGESQPFFAVFNYGVTHESQIRRPNQTLQHEPKEVPLPPYHPDTLEMRINWTQYYDRMTQMDAQVGSALKELDDAGLSDDTIIFYYGDHGPGLPRGKRTPYHSGLHVPLIIHVPDKWKHLASDDYEANGTSSRMVGFVDFAPTVLSTAGIKPPAHMQGHAFMGEFEADPQLYMYGFRDRMDERYDMIRTVQNGRHQYVRNYMPHLPLGQHVEYMFKTPATQSWYALYQEGKLHPPQSNFWESKPSEELYDLVLDPHTTNNLIKEFKHNETVKLMREQLNQHLLAVNDLGFLAEPEWQTERKDAAPYTFGQSTLAPHLASIKRVADKASEQNPTNINLFQNNLRKDHPGIRYWAVMGIYILGDAGVKMSLDELRNHLDDPSAAVAIAAARALAHYGMDTDLEPALDVLFRYSHLDRHGIYRAMHAVNALDVVWDSSPRVENFMEAVDLTHESVPRPLNGNIPSLQRHILKINAE